MFLQQLLQGMGVLDSEDPPPTPLLCDNNAAIQLTQDSVWHSNTKHFCIKYHSTHDLVRTRDLEVVSTKC